MLLTVSKENAKKKSLSDSISFNACYRNPESVSEFLTGDSLMKISSFTVCIYSSILCLCCQGNVSYYNDILYSKCLNANKHHLITVKQKMA